MKFDTIQFLEDYGIHYIEHSSITTSRYVGLSTCPFCGATGKAYAAMGREFNAFSCWICHETNFNNAIKILTGITSYEEINQIYKRYGVIISGYSDTEIVRPTTISVPGKEEMLLNSKKYLESRNFNAEYVWNKYQLKNTAMDSSFGYRIVLPIILDSRVISFTARDYTNVQDTKYKSCPSLKEVYPHKNSLYNIDNAKGNNVVVVEGPMDAWRIGDGAVALFGTEFTLPQLILLAERFDNIYFLFDGGESEALKQAERASTIITSVGKNSEVLEMEEGDPDEVFQDEEELIYLKKDLQLF